MNRPQQRGSRAWSTRLAGIAALGALLTAAGPALAQFTNYDQKVGIVDSEVKPASGHLGPAEKLIPYQSNSLPLGCYGCGGAGCGGCGDCSSGLCGGPGCVPGRLDCCDPCQGKTMLGRFLCGIHSMICCPDPCYEPCFIPAANAGFFLDSAKPVSQARFRYNAMSIGNTPQQGGYYWNSTAGNFPAAATFVHDLILENEMAIDRFSLTVSTPFRITVGGGGAGYSDMRIATKTLMLDTEFLMASFQFSTILPTGITTTGGGNGNVGLEPSLLLTMKVADHTFLQTQLAEWIGILTGESVFHYHFSLNHMLTAPRRDMQLIGTMEYGSYVFPNAPTFYNIGPGLRFHFCNKVDVGFGVQFNVSNNHFFDQLYRTELRWRF